MNFFKRLGLASATLLLLPAAAFAQQTTTVAIESAPSGYAAQATLKGATMAVEDINARGGVLGTKLVLDAEDDACDVKQVRSVAEKIVSAGNIRFVVGPDCSEAIPASEIYAAGNVLQIAPTLNNPILTERGLWNVARVVGRDDRREEVAGNYIAINYAHKNIAILNDEMADTKARADRVRKALNVVGVTEKMRETYDSGGKDFSALVSRLKRNKIDLVYIPYVPPWELLRQMRDNGLRTVLTGYAPLFLDGVQEQLFDGMLFIDQLDPSKRPTASDLVERFKSRYTYVYDSSLNTYAAFEVWSKAVEKAQTTEPRKVMETIKAGSWDTVIGKLEFDAKGDIKQAGYAVYRHVAGGHAVEVYQPSAPMSSDWDLTGIYPAGPSPKPSTAPAQVAAAPPSTAPSPRPSASPSSLPAVSLPAVAPSSPPPVQEIARAPSAPVALGRRVALVMGNSAYRSMPTLANPRNDAADVGAALKALGFETIVQTDLNKAAMNGALSQFSKAVRGADVAMIYYSGHGMQFEGKNYLLPVDANLENSADVNRFELTAVDDLIDVLSAASGMRLIVLDACRNNAAERDFKNRIASAAGGNRDVASTRGFSRINPRNGLVVAYSTASGEVAADGTGRNSPFTEAFLKNVSTPDMEVRQMLFQVQTDVFNTTHTQLPEISSLYVGPAIRLKLSANKP
jgi:branched-chain amino acid transport system substrate-binding protein